MGTVMDTTMATTMVTTMATLPDMRGAEVVRTIMFTRTERTESIEQRVCQGQDRPQDLLLDLPLDPLLDPLLDRPLDHPRNQTICSAIEMEMFTAET